MKHWKTIKTFESFEAASAKRTKLPKDKESRIRHRADGTYDLRIVTSEDESTFPVHEVSGKARRAMKRNLRTKHNADKLAEIAIAAIKAAPKVTKPEVSEKVKRERKLTRQQRRKNQKEQRRKKKKGA